MADTTQLRVADRDSFSNDDPFAELTRIMGFDPREPVQQPEPAPASATNTYAQPVDDVADDFGIDLEKELMGEFGLDEGVQESVQSYSQPEQYSQAAQYDQVEQSYSADAEEAAFEQALAEPETDAFAAQAFDAQEVYFEPVDPVVEGYVSEAAERHAEPASYTNVADDHAAEAAVNAYAPDATGPENSTFDDAITASMEDELSFADDWASLDAEPEQEAVAEAVQPVAYEPSFETSYEPVADYERAAPAVAEPAFEEPAFDGLDESVSASLENDAALNGDWQLAQEVEPAHIADESWDVSSHAPEIHEEPSLAVSGYEPAATGVENFSDDFDGALADVDMDFTAVPLSSAGGSFFDPHGDLDTAPEVGVQADEPAAVETSAPSLEDELNALLGNVTAPISGPVQASPAVEVEPATTYAPEAETVEEVDFALDDADFLSEPAASAPEQDSPVVEPAFMQARSDYGYSRGNFRVPQPNDDPTEYAEESYSAPVEEAYVAAEPVVQEYEPVVHEYEPELVAESEPELDLDFDEDAFDAAFARSIGDDDTQQVEEPQAAAPEGDPYAELAALTASFKKSDTGVSWQQPAAAPAAATQQTEASFEQMNYNQNAYSASDFNEYPDIETVEVPEQAVALADDLDIPELTFEEDVPVAPAFDDLDAEFAGILNEMTSPEPVAPQPAKPVAAEVDDFVADFEREFQLDSQTYQSGGYAAAGMAAAAAGAFGAATASRSNAAPVAADFGAASAAPRGQYQHPPLDDFEYDPDAEDEDIAPAHAAREQRPQRRGMLIAAVIGGVVVLGGVGAFALSGGGGSGTPAIIKADETPVKVRPENPGGSAVPNQDSKVYETVARTPSSEPNQQKLVTTAETPIDMTAQEEAPLDDEETIVGGDEGVTPAGKSEDRIQQAIQNDGAATQNTEVAAVTPRKVRTMVVRSDGTLVPREDPTPAIDPATTASDGVPARTNAAQASEPVPAEATAAVKVPANTQPSSTPASVAIATSARWDSRCQASSSRALSRLRRAAASSPSFRRRSPMVQ